MKKFKVVRSVSLAIGLSTAVLSGNTMAQQQAGATQPTGPVICPGYVKGKSGLPGQRVGKKVQNAFEAYNEDDVAGAIDILLDIEAKDSFDRAFVDNFIGKMMIGIDGRAAEAFTYLERAVKEKQLNDSDHANTLKLLGQLGMQEKKYESAIGFFKKWMDFTCKEDAEVYTRIAQAHMELKQYAEMIEPADKAIELYEEPNKNPYILKLSSYFERKMINEMVDIGEQLVVLFPENKQWWTQLGSFYLQIEDYDRALSVMDAAYLQGFLDKESQIKLLAQLYAATGAPERAARLKEKHLGELLQRDADMLTSVAKSYHQAREFKTAAKYWGEAAKLSSDPKHFEEQGTLLLIAQDYRGAITALGQALDRGAEDVGGIHYTLMEANFHSGNFKAAHVHAKEARKDPSVRRNANAWIPYIETKAKNRGISL
ncbi:hypothetical protein DRW07_17220 [Alteromonas sediminis]|uniref:Uncharacterized protein n=1 Tax=Alteromonas sediminis TaxID=2259342 RepID=A0A3N5XYM0_9ALTE|nr:hypothetical protein [Alteromonas sediminis]RPJ65056.1 hypothetical protein DRW07_17220 [Alteromonas sediminis]